MATWTYEESIRELLKSEGGYVNHPSDPGGPTNYGITIGTARRYWKRDASAADVRNMPLSVAKSIYKAKYWDALRCDDLPAGVDFAVFDFGVNSGIKRSAQYIQRIVRVDDDGIIGDETIKAINKRNPEVLIRTLCDIRMAFLKRIRTWKVFGRGWTRRVDRVRRVASRMAGAANAPHRPEPVPPKPVASKPKPAPSNSLWSHIKGWFK